MKAHVASFVNAVVLIAISILGYIASGMASFTALIPAVFGVALLACNAGVKAENKVISHIAVVLTLIVFIALITPMTAAFGRGDVLAIIRLVLMEATTAVALVVFIKSFIDARKRSA